MTDRCAFTDFPRDTCGHCLGHVGPNIGRIKPLPAAPAYPPGYRPSWTPATPNPTPRDWHDGDKSPTRSTRCTRTDDGYVLAEHLASCEDRRCNGCKPCAHDEHGNPTRHCEARVVCTEHLDDAHPRTCPRCIARVRADLAHIVRLSALMLDEAIVTGIESHAAMIAGPAADPAALDDMREWLRWHGVVDELLPLHDDRHPYTLLARWELKLAAVYDHPRPAKATIASAANYLAWLLTDIAQDPADHFQTLAKETAQCRTHLEAVLGASRAPERGAPCWECPDDPDRRAPRLTRRRAHWCERPDCTREHDRTGARDTWRCPRNPDHVWTEAEYRKITYEDAVAEGLKPRRARGRRAS